MLCPVCVSYHYHPHLICAFYHPRLIRPSCIIIRSHASSCAPCISLSAHHPVPLVLSSSPLVSSFTLPIIIRTDRNSHALHIIRASSASLVLSSAPHLSLLHHYPRLILRPLYLFYHLRLILHLLYYHLCLPLSSTPHMQFPPLLSVPPITLSSRLWLSSTPGKIIMHTTSATHRLIQHAALIPHAISAPCIALA